MLELLNCVGFRKTAFQNDAEGVTSMNASSMPSGCVLTVKLRNGKNRSLQARMQGSSTRNQIAVRFVANTTAGTITASGTGHYTSFSIPDSATHIYFIQVSSDSATPATFELCNGVFTSIGDWAQELWWPTTVSGIRYFSFYMLGGIEAAPRYLPSGMSFIPRFESCDTLTMNPSSWNTSSVSNFSYFTKNTLFNGDISNWDTSNGTSFYNMFLNNSRFNQDLSKWNMLKATAIDNMFSGASSFNSDMSRVIIPNTATKSNYDKGAVSWNLSYRPRFV